MKGINKIFKSHFKSYLIVLLLVFLSACGGVTPTTYTITVTYGAGGQIEPEGVIAVNGGESQTFNIYPYKDNEIENVQVDGISMGPILSYTFTNVKKNHTIHATFLVQGLHARVYN